MRIQLLSDLHLETEVFTPEPAPGAELLVIAGDVDSTWAGLNAFARWPVPVLFVAGNHEFDGREWTDAWPALRERCEQLGLRLLERESAVISGADGRRIRFVGTTRWCDFDLFGEVHRERAMRAASYFVKVMRATRRGQLFDPAAVRDEALSCRAWLAAELAKSPTDELAWDATVAITHYGPSLRSADPRYGRQPGTASFCNADDDLLPLADAWLHGHLHCRHDYRVEHGAGRSTRVVSNARGHGRKGESLGHDGAFTIEV
ncbi:metallophosphoesterase [Aquabacterium sp.]|uniref:metallophosphoesterase n=1 Tax=Aquabacterium sp. TaxID=1872578 RepID=UPI0035B424A5